MEDFGWLKILVSGGLISGLVAILTLLLQRFWSRKDRKESKETAIMQKLTEIEVKFDGLSEKLQKEHESNEEYRARQSRVRILQFNDEVIRHIDHTRESFDDIIAEIDAYNDYCDLHPSFPNFKAVAAIDNIKRVYKKCCEDNSFLR